MVRILGSFNRPFPKLLAAPLPPHGYSVINKDGRGPSGAGDYHFWLLLIVIRVIANVINP